MIPESDGELDLFDVLRECIRDQMKECECDDEVQPPTSPRHRKIKTERIIGSSRRKGWRGYLKQAKNRYERRKAKMETECTPSYGKFRGYS